jgi:flavodoxin
LIQDLEELAPNWKIVAAMAEKTQPDDLLKGRIVVLASATWNTGGSEGQLNPHMRALLQEKATNLDLGGKPCACIGLGDDRYFYTARAVDLLQDYVTGHHGRLILPSLEIVNEPYGQEEKVRVWARQLVDASLKTGWS